MRGKRALLVLKQADYLLAKWEPDSFLLMPFAYERPLCAKSG
jgi:hypothetical protein